MPTVLKKPLTNLVRKLNRLALPGRNIMEHHYQQPPLPLLFQHWRNHLHWQCRVLHRQVLECLHSVLHDDMQSQDPGTWDCLVILVNSSQINSKEVAVNFMIWLLPPHHGISKFRAGLRAHGPLLQILGAWLADHVWSPNLVLVTQFHTEIHMVCLLYEIGNRFLVGSLRVLTVDVAENIGAIFTYAGCHFIHMKQKITCSASIHSCKNKRLSQKWPNHDINLKWQ